MKVNRKKLTITSIMVMGTICTAFGASQLFAPKNSEVSEYVYISQANASFKEESTESTDKALEDETTDEVAPEETNSTKVEKNQEATEEPIVEEPSIVYDNMTLEELSAKLDRSLKSTLSGTGSFIASYSLQTGVDPYLATAIMLHETGCSYNCSSLVSQCYNVGGMKGSPSCGTSGYKTFNSLEDGITAFINNLANNYYARGLTTAEQMNRYYAESTTWATQVNTYISKISAS